MLFRSGFLNLPQPTKRDLLSDALLNARLGSHYLARLIEGNGGDEERALIAYNAGPGRLKRWIDEAGSYAAWRDARERAGNSDVLAYAREVLNYQKRFADRGAIAPTAVSEAPITLPDPEPSAAPAAPDFVGPPAPVSKQ